MTDGNGKNIRESLEREWVGEPGAIKSEVAAGGTLADRVEKTKTRQKSYLMDLRVHSPASIGYLGVGGIDTAPALVRLAKVKGLDMIAVTDFYSAEFVDKVAEAAKTMQLTIIPGAVIRCKLGVWKCAGA